MGWSAYEDGATIGQRGSENGVVVRDEEHRDGARITLEEGGAVAPLAITCGVYGWMVHTRFFSSQEEAEEEYEKMKDGLNGILAQAPFEDDPDAESNFDRALGAVSAFVQRHP